MFQEWPKTPRFEDSKLYFTEKIDGTNACIIIGDSDIDSPDGAIQKVIGVQSRNKLITPDDDNMGFARWVYDNQEEIVSLLGAGYHYGEWWGRGIQRTYGMETRVFSLFNAGRWGGLFNAPVGKMVLDCVPQYTADFKDIRDLPEVIHNAKEFFMPKSLAAAKYGVNFTNPEGFMMFHDRSRQLYKFPINK